MNHFILACLVLFLAGCFGLPIEVSEESIETTKKVVGAVGDITGTHIAGGVVGIAVTVLTALKLIKVKKEKA